MRLRKKSRLSVLLFLFFGLTMDASAQKTFKYEADVNKVDSTGFYRIELQPAFIAKSNAGLSDIRLIDAKGNFVPYVTAGSMPQTDNTEFMVLPEVVTPLKPDTGTSFVVECREEKPINKLWINLRNTSAERYMNLAGSDDLKHWFAIEENISLNNGKEGSNGTLTEQITFPASNYRYLKLLVNDKNKTPVKFVGAGIYRNASIHNVYQPILLEATKQADSNKSSWFTIKLRDNYQVNKLHLKITEPAYFKRPVSVYDDSGASPVLISESELNSSEPLDLFLSVKTNRLLLKIDNADSPPLKIAGATLYQADEYIVSYLEAGQSYKLLTGDRKATTPEYDLKFFTDSIRSRIPTINHAPVVANALFAAPAPKIVRPDRTPVIWAAIITALIVLSLLTWKMIGEVKNKAGQD